MRDVYLKDDVEQDRTVWEKETEVYIAIAGKGVRNRITLVGGDSGTGKTVLYEMLEDVRLTEQYNAIKLFNYKSENMKESLMKCRDCFIVIDSADIEKTLQYLAGFKRFSTEKVMKSLAGELTENEKWSIKGSLMGECGMRIAAFQSI